MKVPLFALLVFFCLCCLPVSAEPTAVWDGFIENPPHSRQEADHISLMLNEIYLLELKKLDKPPIRWWVRRASERARQNLQTARRRLEGASDTAESIATPRWKDQAQRFLSDYVAEEARLARLYPKWHSEVYLEPGEEAGWDLADGCFRLTFDDGPKPGRTENVIHALHKAGYPATFFVLGQNVQKSGPSSDFPNYKGFTLGSHTYDHTNLVSLTDDQVVWQLQKTQQVADSVGITLSKQFRAPYGSRGPRELEIANRLGLHSVMWNVDSQDWQTGMQSRPGRIASRTLALMILHRRGIVLMHDIHAQTALEVELLIPALKAAGFQVVE